MPTDDYYQSHGKKAWDKAYNLQLDFFKRCHAAGLTFNQMYDLDGFQRMCINYADSVFPPIVSESNTESD